VGRPRKYPRWQQCNGCPIVFQNVTGQRRRFHSVECAANHRPELQQVEFDVPPPGSAAREQYDRWQSELQEISDALAQEG